MPLINLLTDPTAFKYNSKTRSFGGDRPGNGDSGLPYIKFPAGGQTNEEKFKKFFSMNSTGLDYPIRGGSIVTDPMSNTSIHAQIDKERISKFFEDKPRGDAFLKKQAGLQLSNPKVQTGDTIYLQRLGYIPGPIENTRVYNDGKNTLAQVAAAGTGINLRRAGVIPFGINDKFYQDVVGAELGMNIEEVQKNNRLLILADLKMRQRDAGAEISLKQTVSNINKINSLGISLNREILFQYLGGPGSVYGVGSTTIKRSKTSDTTEAANYGQNMDTRGFQLTSAGRTYDRIRNQTPSTINNGIISDYGDFRLADKDIDPKAKYTWGDQSIDIRFFDGRVDKMNKLGVQFGDSVEGYDPFKDIIQSNVDGQKVEDASSRQDMIKFLFECVQYENNNRWQGGLDGDKLLFFRAHLTQIADNNTGNWNAFKYFGRGESFYTYQGFERSISFGFRIALGSAEELDATYEKLEALMSQVYPDYSPIGLMRAPIVRLTIGNYLYRVPGILDSVNVTIDQSSTWETVDGIQLPHVIDVSTTFKPILEQLPQRNADADLPLGGRLIKQSRKTLSDIRQAESVSQQSIAENSLRNQLNEEVLPPIEDQIKKKASFFNRIFNG